MLVPVIFERVASNCQYAGSKPLSSTVGIQMGALARLVGIPAAPVQLAVRDGVRGTLVKDVRLPQALMPEVVLNCDRDDPGQRGHNVEAIQQALARFAAPADPALLPTFRAFDLPRVRRIDRHGDRHDRNWAVLAPPLGTKYVEALCPSFDHAASLGFTLTDQTPAQHLHDG